MVAAAMISRLILLPLVAFASSPRHAFVSTAITSTTTIEQQRLRREPQQQDSISILSTTLSSKIHDDEENNGANSNHLAFHRRASATRRMVLQQMLFTTTIGTSGGMVMATPGSATAASVPTTPVSLGAAAEITSRSTYWPLGKVAFSLLPLAGTYTRRATIFETVCAAKDDGRRDGLDITTSSGMRNGIVWTLDQIQGVVNVNVPVRMVVIKVSARTNRCTCTKQSQQTNTNLVSLEISISKTDKNYTITQQHYPAIT